MATVLKMRTVVPIACDLEADGETGCLQRVSVDGRDITDLIKGQFDAWFAAEVAACESIADAADLKSKRASRNRPVRTHLA